MTASHDHRPRSAIVAARRASRRKLPVLPDEYFACASLRGRQKRHSCAARWRTFNVRPTRAVDLSKRDTGQASRVGSLCSGCQIGAKHAFGNVPPEAPTVPAPVAVTGQVRLPFSLRIGVGS